MTTPRLIHVVGGGTRQYLDGSHLYLGSKAMGGTARRIAELCREYSEAMDVVLTLTDMAGGQQGIDTNEDLAIFAQSIISDVRTKIVFWTPSVLDFHVFMEAHEGRLKTADGVRNAELQPTEKLVEAFRKREGGRKDIFLVACKQTAGATESEQYEQALLMLKRTSANVVLANDAVTKVNMVVTPEEAVYSVTTDRDAALRELVEIAYLRSPLTFTQSTVVAGEAVPWIRLGSRSTADGSRSLCFGWCVQARQWSDCWSLCRQA